MLVERWRLTSVNEELVGDARMVDVMYRTGKYGSKNFKVCKHSLKITDRQIFSNLTSLSTFFNTQQSEEIAFSQHCTLGQPYRTSRAGVDSRT